MLVAAAVGSIDTWKKINYANGLALIVLYTARLDQ